MRALRILVTVMGIVIIVGFGVVIAVIAGRLSRGGVTAPRSFSAANIDIPRGARIAAMTTAQDRLILEIILPDGGPQLVVIDLATGTRLGTIGLNPAP
jgi:Family of unknown function (DUF6476)